MELSALLLTTTASVGAGTGLAVGLPGVAVGAGVGRGVGAGVGRGVGAGMGLAVGSPGIGVGYGVGLGVGLGVGDRDGRVLVYDLATCSRTRLLRLPAVRRILHRRASDTPVASHAGPTRRRATASRSARSATAS